MTMKQDNKNKNELSHLCHLIDHPVLQHYLSTLRKKDTSPAEFRRIVYQMSFLMVYEATKDLSLKEVEIVTPMETTQGKIIQDKVIIVSILRAGNGMLAGLLDALPFASVGHIGIYRDKFLQTTVEYYFRLPNDMEKKKIFLCDPLLATADTAMAAINRLKDYDVGPIRLICLISSKEGIKKLKQKHPDVEIYTSCIERELNADGFLLPGVGDAGDRLYGTL